MTLRDAPINGFIDGIITVTIDDKHLVNHKNNSALLSIHTMCILILYMGLLQLNQPLFIIKQKVYGQLNEIHVVLGRNIYSQCFKFLITKEKGLS